MLDCFIHAFEFSHILKTHFTHLLSHSWDCARIICVVLRPRNSSYNAQCISHFLMYLKLSYFCCFIDFLVLFLRDGGPRHRGGMMSSQTAVAMLLGLFIGFGFLDTAVAVRGRINATEVLKPNFLYRSCLGPHLCLDSVAPWVRLTGVCALQQYDTKNVAGRCDRTFFPCSISTVEDWHYPRHLVAAFAGINIFEHAKEDGSCENGIHVRPGQQPCCTRGTLEVYNMMKTSDDKMFESKDIPASVVPCDCSCDSKSEAVCEKMREALAISQ